MRRRETGIIAMVPVEKIEAAVRFEVLGEEGRGAEGMLSHSFEKELGEEEE